MTKKLAELYTLFYKKVFYNKLRLISDQNQEKILKVGDAGNKVA